MLYLLKTFLLLELGQVRTSITKAKIPKIKYLKVFYKEEIYYHKARQHIAFPTLEEYK